jgi:hypothetical protein
VERGPVWVEKEGKLRATWLGSPVAPVILLKSPKTGVLNGSILCLEPIFEMEIKFDT